VLTGHFDRVELQRFRQIRDGLGHGRNSLTTQIHVRISEFWMVTYLLNTLHKQNLNLHNSRSRIQLEFRLLLKKQDGAGDANNANLQKSIKNQRYGILQIRVDGKFANVIRYR
jgi:hypothetical protein